MVPRLYRSRLSLRLTFAVTAVADRASRAARERRARLAEERWGRWGGPRQQYLVGAAAARRRAAVFGRARLRAHILVQAYLVTQACSLLRLFRHKFAENGPQKLKMV